jgi:hypothetical protein
MGNTDSRLVNLSSYRESLKDYKFKLQILEIMTELENSSLKELFEKTKLDIQNLERKIEETHNDIYNTHVQSSIQHDQLMDE